MKALKNIGISLFALLFVVVVMMSCERGDFEPLGQENGAELKDGQGFGNDFGSGDDGSGSGDDNDDDDDDPTDNDSSGVKKEIKASVDDLEEGVDLKSSFYRLKDDKVRDGSDNEDNDDGEDDGGRESGERS